MQMLAHASHITLDVMDSDNIEYLNQLRESILEAYTGILQGFGADGKGELFLPFLESVMGFLEILSKDENKENIVVKGAAGLIGDLGSSLGPSVGTAFAHPCVKVLLTAAANSSDEATQTTATWAKSIVTKLGST